MYIGDGGYNHWVSIVCTADQITPSHVRLPAEEAGALAGAALAAGRGGRGDREVRGVRGVVTQVSLSLTGGLTVTAVDLVLKHGVVRGKYFKLV